MKMRSPALCLAQKPGFIQIPKKSGQQIQTTSEASASSGFEVEMEVSKKCSIPGCEAEGKFKCGNCKTANYCSKEHQKSDWKLGHKHNCFPVTFGWDAVRGNELVATRDISQGEIILKEKAIVSGPSGKTDVGEAAICLGCNQVLPINKDEAYVCSSCGWPVCSQACEKATFHSEAECATFKAQKVPPFKYYQQYEFLYILRCLLLKITNPTKWESFKRFESHDVEREANLMESLLNHAAAEFILKTCALASVLDEKEVNFASGVIHTNAMGDSDAFSKAGKTRKCGSYLYILGCLICHSCTPNVYRAIQPSGDLHVRAIIPIKAGQPFLTTYTDLALTSEERRTFLSSFYYFTCSCPRCTDPTELGTFFSGVKCTSCSVSKPSDCGYLLAKEQLDTSTSWICNNPACAVVREKSYVSEIVTRVKEEWESIAKDHTEKCIDEFEEYLKRNRGITLHPNHALIYRAEYDIIQTVDYMLSASRIPNQATRMKLAKRQVNLLRNGLSLMGTFWRGYSSYRGRLLYFLQNALLRLLLARIAQNLRENKRSAPEKLSVQQSLSEIMDLRKEAVEILKFDPPGKDERAISEALESKESPELQIVIKYCTS